MFNEQTFAIPDLTELSVRIGRAARFAGGTGKHFWSTLHHSFVVEAIVGDIAIYKSHEERDAMMFYGLIYNLSNAITGDIPKRFVSPEIRATREFIDAQIYKSLRVDPPTPKILKVVRTADRRATLAEGLVLKVAWDETSDFERASAECQDSDETLVKDFLETYGTSTMVVTENSPGVRAFVDAVLTYCPSARTLVSEAA